jgi:hypothetical protein
LKDVEGSLAISVFEGGPGHRLKNVGQEASGLRRGSCGDFVGSRRGEMMESERGQRGLGGLRRNTIEALRIRMEGEGRLA